MTAVPLGDVSRQQGRTIIRSVAIRRVVEAVAADVAGVPAVRVNVALGDDHGGLAVRVTTPVGIVSCAAAAASLADRAGAIVESVSARLAELVGRSVERVDVRITGLCEAVEQRVR